MFQFPRCPPHRYGLAMRSWVMKPTGLPHSEIPGYASTRLTEAYRSVATSFIGPRRPGIHPAPLLVCGPRRPGLRSAARRRAGVNGVRTASCATTTRMAGGPCPARPGSHTAMCAKTRIPRRNAASENNDVDKNLCGWEGAPSGSSHGGSDGSGEPPVGACIHRRGPRVRRRYQTEKCVVRRAQKRLEGCSSHRTSLWLECRY